MSTTSTLAPALTRHTSQPQAKHMPTAMTRVRAAGLSEPEQARLGRMARFAADLSGYMKVQSTRPQTLAYGLTDSPGRPARLDRRKIPGVDRLSGGSRGCGRPRPVAHQRHALLADRHGRILGAAVRGDRRAAPDRRGAAASRSRPGRLGWRSSRTTF